MSEPSLLFVNCEPFPHFVIASHFLTLSLRATDGAAIQSFRHGRQYNENQQKTNVYQKYESYNGKIYMKLYYDDRRLLSFSPLRVSSLSQPFRPWCKTGLPRHPWLAMTENKGDGSQLTVL